MNTKTCPRQLAIDLLERSTCKVKMAAVLYDRHGIYGWGWNGYNADGGRHAEQHALQRANRRRWKGSTIVVAGRRKGWVFSFPCSSCLERIMASGMERIEWINKVGKWEGIDL